MKVAVLAKYTSLEHLNKLKAFWLAFLVKKTVEKDKANEGLIADRKGVREQPPNWQSSRTWSALQTGPWTGRRLSPKHGRGGTPCAGTTGPRHRSVLRGNHLTLPSMEPLLTYAWNPPSKQGEKRCREQMSLATPISFPSPAHNPI